MNIQRPFDIEKYYHRKVRYVLDLKWWEDPNDLALIEHIRDAYLPGGGTSYAEALAFEEAVTRSSLTVKQFLARCHQ